jgi:hypothetical protein
MCKMYIVPLILIALCFTGVKASAYEILNETIEHDGKVRKFNVFVIDGLSDVPVSLVPPSTVVGEMPKLPCSGNLKASGSNWQN